MSKSLFVLWHMVFCSLLSRIASQELQVKNCKKSLLDSFDIFSRGLMNERIFSLVLYEFMFKGPKLEEKQDYFQHWRGLDWRLDVVVQTRAKLANKLEPLICMNLTLSDGMTSSFDTDPNTLVNITESLEQALKLAKGAQARKLQRHL
jgi:hypothetical protein